MPISRHRSDLEIESNAQEASIIAPVVVVASYICMIEAPMRRHSPQGTWLVKGRIVPLDGLLIAPALTDPEGAREGSPDYLGERDPRRRHNRSSSRGSQLRYLLPDCAMHEISSSSANCPPRRHIQAQLGVE
jgi:hypothetical protein